MTDREIDRKRLVSRRNLEVAVDYFYDQGLISQHFTVDEMFDDAVRKALNGSFCKANHG